MELELWQIIIACIIAITSLAIVLFIIYYCLMYYLIENDKKTDYLLSLPKEEREKIYFYRLKTNVHFNEIFTYYHRKKKKNENK